MGRRTRTTSIPCQHAGCPEVGRFEYDSQREATRIYRDYAKWKCVRHAAGDAVLAAANPTRTCVLTVVVFPHLPEHRFFQQDGVTAGASGFVYGPGFQAHAEDFPVGTRLTVTASIELPATIEPPTPEGPPGGEG